MCSLRLAPWHQQEIRMRICAIILNYFGHPDTIECVRALLEDDTLTQVVIVENSANEAERSQIEGSFLHRERVRILSPGKNLGFAGGVNFALGYFGIGSFDAFLILNNDTLIPVGTLRQLEKGLASSGYDFVAPVIYGYPHTTSIWSKGDYYNRFTGLIFHHLMGFVPGNLYYLTGCCLLIPSWVFETLGSFDETFFMYGEDIEFCFRANRKGVKFGLVPEAKIFHKGTGSSGNNSLFYEYHMNRSHLLLCARLARTPKEAWFSWALKSIALSMRAIWRVFRFGNFNSLRGLRLSVFASLR
jgi:N-acetylglucosaminyl-diphospho-decaprenol L-rhamnosyltransferase